MRSWRLKLLLAFLCFLSFLPFRASGGIEIKKTTGEARQVKSDTYTADIAADGAMTNLAFKGEQLLKPGVGVSRGAYCFQHGAVDLNKIEQPDGSTIVVKADGKPTVTYAFGADGVAISVVNSTAAPLQFFFVLDAPFNVVADDRGEMLKAPTGQQWGSSSWYSNSHAVHIDGASEIWGPYLEGANVVQTDLRPGETRKLTVHLSDVPADTAARVAQVREGKFVEPDVAIDSPKPWQVFQRRIRSSGIVRVSGHLKTGADAVEVRLAGKSLDGDLPDKWQPATLDRTTRSFNAEFATPAGGWYSVQVQAKTADKITAHAEVENVGVGEVFVIAGQSNSTNYGEKRQEPQSGLASTFDGQSWRPAADPQPGTHDNSTGGSPWPAFADAMAARYHVPIGIACTGHGGTSVNAWQPGGELLHHTVTRIDQLGYHGFRAVLWHQGEADTAMPTDEYAARLTNTIFASRRLAGWEFPWFVAQVSYRPKDQVFKTTRDAQQRLWDQGIALPGPDTDTLIGDTRDNNGAGIHLSEKGLKAHGKLWEEKVGVWLDKVLAGDPGKQ